MLSKRNKPKPNLALSGERAFEVLRRPIITEKASLASVNGQYVFQVAMDATKAEIKAAVEQLFSVDVKAVNSSIAKGKTKRVSAVVLVSVRTSKKLMSLWLMVSRLTRASALKGNEYRWH